MERGFITQLVVILICLVIIGACLLAGMSITPATPMLADRVSDNMMIYQGQKTIEEVIVMIPPGASQDAQIVAVTAYRMHRESMEGMVELVAMYETERAVEHAAAAIAITVVGVCFVVAMALSFVASIKRAQ